MKAFNWGLNVQRFMVQKLMRFCFAPQPRGMQRENGFSALPCQDYPSRITQGTSCGAQGRFYFYRALAIIFEAHALQNGRQRKILEHRKLFA
ncbi:hypothetical protein C6Y40_11340 [Alteromonas alba]|uniref:Uncharacterized protein n=1 Tax=Alteromonas alba TaxID=2079529 RepID=A0A2S9VAJ7_9ALTE|nr:hypothetical protein C6Y40_11340 [Alteromonas alba]